MRIFVKFILVILLLFPLEAFAKPVVAVLSVDSNTVATYSYILNNTSAMIAEDVVNDFRKGYSFEAKKLLVEKLPQKEIIPVQTSYADAGYVDYDLLDKLNKTVKADYILLLTSYMDIQSHLLDETVWNMLNIAGLDTFSSKYYLYTHATFWNAKDKTVVWEKMYENKLSADDFNIVNPVSTPNYTQIKNVKKISNHIAKDIVLKSKILVFGPDSEEEMQEYQRSNGSFYNLNFKKKRTTQSQPKIIQATPIQNTPASDCSGQLKQYNYFGVNAEKKLAPKTEVRCLPVVVEDDGIYEYKPKRNFLNLKFNKKLMEN